MFLNIPIIIKGYQENQASPNLADPYSTSLISCATIIYGKELCHLQSLHQIIVSVCFCNYLGSGTLLCIPPKDPF